LPVPAQSNGREPAEPLGRRSGSTWGACAPWPTITLHATSSQAARSRRSPPSPGWPRRLRQPFCSPRAISPSIRAPTPDAAPSPLPSARPPPVVREPKEPIGPRPHHLAPRDTHSCPNRIGVVIGTASHGRRPCIQPRLGARPVCFCCRACRLASERALLHVDNLHTARFIVAFSLRSVIASSFPAAD
jgi:hypothetical protein